MSTDMDATEVADLRRLVGELARRVDALETELAARASRAARPSEDVLLAISAAVAAYLGKRATLRQVHLARNTAWAQQGRAAIMASHHDPHRPR